MTAYDKDRNIRNSIDGRCNVAISINDANTLRRAAMTLHRWAELECGDSDQYKSWAISRDEETGKPRMEIHYHEGRSRYRPIADREKGALKRVAKLCAERGLHFYHQTDPRGAALYVSTEPLTDRDYVSHGFAIC